MKTVIKNYFTASTYLNPLTNYSIFFTIGAIFQSLFYISEVWKDKATKRVFDFTIIPPTSYNEQNKSLHTLNHFF